MVIHLTLKRTSMAYCSLDRYESLVSIKQTQPVAPAEPGD